MDDWYELTCGLDPNLDDTNDDTDGDGFTNIFEYTWPRHFYFTPLNAGSNDSDNDGMDDAYEILYFPDLDPLIIDGYIDADGDMLSNHDEYTNGTNPKAKDTDGDYMWDGWEIFHGYNATLWENVTGDFDGDGLEDHMEFMIGADPDVRDTDGDGLLDGDEYHTHGTNATKTDTDNDTMSDWFEVTWGAPFNATETNMTQSVSDFDGDLLWNRYESEQKSNPFSNDTDSDSMNDTWEYYHRPFVNATFGADNMTDPDNDGLVNLLECLINANPGSNDTDSDSMLDGWEYIHGLNVLVNDALLDLDNDALTNILEYTLKSLPESNDSDADGMLDPWEYAFIPWVNLTNGADNVTDADLDGLINILEFQHGGHPGSNDTDADGMLDGWEYTYRTWVDLADGSDNATDADLDGLINIMEFQHGGHPGSNDTDA
nr:hypothetical protein [Candidatus Sigynarchaeota archaeon]